MDTICPIVVLANNPAIIVPIKRKNKCPRLKECSRFHLRTTNSRLRTLRNRTRKHLIRNKVIVL